MQPTQPPPKRSPEECDRILTERLLELQTQKQVLMRKGDLQGVSNLGQLIRDLTHQLNN